MKNVDGKRSARALIAIGLLVISALLPTWQSGHAQSAQVVAILNARNPTRAVSKADAKKMFLGQTAFWHGVVPVKVVARPDGSSASQAFYPSVVGLSPASFRKHWDELQLSGRGVAPPQAATVEDVARMVSATPGGVSFALASEMQGKALAGVKTVPIQ